MNIAEYREEVNRFVEKAITRKATNTLLKSDYTRLIFWEKV
jgi:hypothetical protein